MWLVFFSIVISLVETIGISAIMPFIDIAIDFNQIHENQYYKLVFNLFGFKSDVDFAISFGVLLLGFYIFRGLINSLYVYSMANYSQKLYAKITKKIFIKYLSMPFNVFTSQNSSNLNKAIISEASLMSGVIRSLLLMISEIFIVVSLYALLLFASWKITLIFTLMMVITLIFLVSIISKKVKLAGLKREKAQSEMYEILNRLFGNFKQIKLQDSRRLFQMSDQFFFEADQYAKSNTIRIFLDSFPRIFIETIGFSLLMLLLVYSLYLVGSNVSQMIPTLSLFVLAMYRLLPSFNRIISGFNALNFYSKSVDTVEEVFKLPQENFAHGTIDFIKRIELKDVSFSFKEELTLNNINIIINKGEKIAFIGESGSGKSTLVDLIIGLYIPDQGEMRIDDVLVDESNLQNWRSQVGYIPQQVYLFDGTISENICLGRSLDIDLLKKVLIQANIFDFLQSKEGLDTLVGEGGIQLSGGQKQRIAIARALYGEPEILVLDEATSALDVKTELIIMNEIYEICQDKTLIIIAHRPNTTGDCDKIYRLKDGTLDEAI